MLVILYQSLGDALIFLQNAEKTERKYIYYSHISNKKLIDFYFPKIKLIYFGEEKHDSPFAIYNLKKSSLDKIYSDLITFINILIRIKLRYGFFTPIFSLRNDRLMWCLSIKKFQINYLKLSEDLSLYDYFGKLIDGDSKLTISTTCNDIINCKKISIFPDSRVESKKISEEQIILLRKYFYKGNIKINRYGEHYKNFEELNNLILEADLTISADSLPAHIAIMMKKKLIIYNPNKKFYPREFYLKNIINQDLIFELNK
jgi:hypothetical protein